MKNARFDRRAFVQSVATGTAAWLLPSLRNAPRVEAASAIPKRLVIFYTDHGTLPQFWATGPGGTGTPTEAAWELGDILKPLAPHKSDLLLMSGLGMRSASLTQKVGGDDHMHKQCHSLTSVQQATTEMAGGISIDQFIVNGLKANNGGTSPTMLPSLMLSVADRGPGPFPWGHPFYLAASQPVPLERIPANAFKRMFPNGAPSAGASPAVDPMVAKRKSMMDLALGEFSAVGNKLGKAERDKLEAHAAAMRDLEQRIKITPTKACSVPPASMFTGGANYWAAGFDQHPRLAQVALACDLTRVVAIHVDEVPDSLCGYKGGMLGTQNSHDLVHQTDRSNGALKANPEGVGVMKKYHQTYAGLFANFLKLLKDTPESDGRTLLDHTAVLWCGEIAEGGHGYENLRWLLAGGGQDSFKTGRLLLWGDYNRSEFAAEAAAPSHSDLFVSLANAMGVQTNTFGLAAACKGPIARLAG